MPELTAAVITVSDSVDRGLRRDASGEAVSAALRERGFLIVRSAVVPDEIDRIQEELRVSAQQARLVVTTGGTGLGPRDHTPEATRGVCERLVEGIAEHMRAAGVQQTPFAILSRGISGTIGTSLVINLPGSPKGAAESLAAVVSVLPHALDLLQGKTQH